MELIRRSESGCAITGTQGLGFVTKDSVVFWVKSSSLGLQAVLPPLSARFNDAVRDSGAA